MFWPCPDEGHPGTPRLFLDRFPTTDGRARFHPIQHRPPAEEPDDEYPLYLTTGRLLLALPVRHADPPRAGSDRGGARAVRRDPSADGPPLRHRAGQLVRLSTRRGAAVLKARLSQSLRLDTLFVPFHWSGDACANLSPTTPSIRSRGSRSSRSAPSASSPCRFTSRRRHGNEPAIARHLPLQPLASRSPSMDSIASLPPGGVHLLGARLGQAAAAGGWPRLPRAVRPARPAHLLPGRELGWMISSTLS